MSDSLKRRALIPVDEYWRLLKVGKEVDELRSKVRTLEEELEIEKKKKWQ
jgi:hypothetical protein